MNYQTFNGMHAGTAWGKLIKKSFVDSHQLRFVPGLTKAQDVLFYAQMYEYLEHAYYLAYSGYIYRLNEGSSYYRYNPSIVESTYMLVEGLGKIADKHDGDVRYQKAMAYTSLFRLYFIDRLYIFHSQSKVRKNEALAIYKDYMNLTTVKKYCQDYDLRFSKKISERVCFFLLKNNMLKLCFLGKRIHFAVKRIKQIIKK